MIGVTTYSDFVQVGGTWWARGQVAADGSGHKLHHATLEIAALAEDAFDQRMQTELAAVPSVQFLRNPLPRFASGARQRAADGSADFTDRIVMLGHFKNLQQWDELLLQLAEAEKLAPDKPGMRWLRTFVLATGRHRQEAKQRLLDEVWRLVAEPQAEEMFLAESLVNCADPYRAGADRLELLELLEPVAGRQPAESHADRRWLSYLAGANDHLQRSEDGLALRKRLAESTPWNLQSQRDYIYYLQEAGQVAAAGKWLEELLAAPEGRSDATDEALRIEYAKLLSKHARWQALLKFTSTWIEAKPQSLEAYKQHLSALIDNDRLEAANLLADEWLKQAQVEGQLGPERQARLHAAADLAQRSAWSTYPHRLNQRWVAPLSAASLFFARRPDHALLTREVMGWSSDDSEDFVSLRGKFLDMLQTDIQQLSPDQASLLVGQCLRHRLEFAQPLNGRRQMDAAEVPADIWKPIAAALKSARWEQGASRTTKIEKIFAGANARVGSTVKAASPATSCCLSCGDRSKQVRRSPATNIRPTCSTRCSGAAGRRRSRSRRSSCCRSSRRRRTRRRS